MTEFIKQFFDIKFWKFILVGIINTLVGMGAMYLYYYIVNDNTFIAFTVNIVVGSVVSFLLNKNFTFKKKGETGSSLVKFIGNIIACYLLSYLIADLLVPKLLSEFSKELVDNISMLLSSCLFVGFNYIGQRFFVFGEKSDKGET